MHYKKQIKQIFFLKLKKKIADKEKIKVSIKINKMTFKGLNKSYITMYASTKLLNTKKKQINI